MITLSVSSTWTAGRGFAPIGRSLLALVLGAVSLAGTGRHGPSVAVVLVTAVGSAAAYVDARTRRIPNRLVSLAAAATAGGTLAAVVVDGPVVVAGVTVGALAFGGPLLACHLASPASVGLGDVKLALVTGAALGLVDARLGLVALCVAAGSTAAVGLLRRRAELPLGPGLAVGTAAALLGQGAIWS